jgi:hypothetical protein
VTPAAVGANTFVATPTETSEAITGLSMQALLAEQVVNVEFVEDEDGAWVADAVELPAAGTWTLRFTVPNRDAIGTVLVITEAPATTTTTTAAPGG